MPEHTLSFAVGPLRKNDCKLQFHALFCQSHQFPTFIVVVIAKNYTITNENCLFFECLPPLTLRVVCGLIELSELSEAINDRQT